MNIVEELECELAELLAKKRITELLFLHFSVDMARMDRKISSEEFDLYLDYITDELYVVAKEKQ